MGIQRVLVAKGKAMSRSNAPLVHLTVKGMEYSLLAAISEHCLELDEQMQQAVKAATEPAALQVMLNEVAEREIRAAVSQEVERFWRYGRGREVIKDTVAAKLDREFEQNRDYYRMVSEGERHEMERVGRTEWEKDNRRVLRDCEDRVRRTRPSAGSDRGGLRRAGNRRGAR